MSLKTRTSRLEMTFSSRDGQTYLETQFTNNPLKVLRPFPLGDGRVLLQLLNVGPGLLAGDVYDLQIEIKTGAKVVLVNQSATKLHRMPAGTEARQTVEVQVEEGGDLELYPGLTIPFAESDAHFETTVNLAEGARFAVLESWAMGRVQRGELFAFRRLSSRLKVVQQDKLIYADGLELTPATAHYHGVSDGFPYLASGFWQWDTPWLPPKVPATPDLQIVSGSCGQGRGYLRALARDGLELKRELTVRLQIWQAQREASALPLARLML